MLVLLLVIILILALAGGIFISKFLFLLLLLLLVLLLSPRPVLALRTGEAGTAARGQAGLSPASTSRGISRETSPGTAARS